MSDQKNQKKQEKLLDSLSELDDEIVEKVSTKRFTLWNQWKRRQKKRNRIVRITAAAACFCMILSAIFIVLFGMGGTVPVYQGMTVMNSAPTDIETASRNNGDGLLSWMVVPVSADQPEDKGNNKDKNKDKNQEKESIDAASMNGKYYANQGEDIYILIHIDNPDDYEILSFTLNGKKYSSYMFEEGSDMETLILKYNVGDAEGIVEYTIDAIKYVDGTKIKDVRMEGDRTVSVGVYSEKQPSVTLTQETVSFHEIVWQFTMSDPLALIAWSDGSLHAELYDGDVKVREQTLEASAEGELRFADLSAGKTYTVKLIGTYDRLDGEGISETLLCEREYTTPEVVMLDGLTAGKETIGFSVRWDERYTPKDLVSFMLYDGETAVRSLSADTTEVTGLLSNHEYRLALEYRKDENKTATVTYEIHTLTKTVPTVELEDLQSTKTEVSFHVEIEDPDAVGRISAVELWRNGVMVQTASDMSTRSFEGLLSNNNYTIRVSYTYDLNDRAGEHTITAEADVKTKAKTASVKITRVDQTHTSLAFALSLTDNDATGAQMTQIELLLDGNVVQTAESIDVRSFANLLSGKAYTIRVAYTCDLNDGFGVRRKTQTLTISTVAKKAPMLELTAGEVTQTTLDFALSLSDTDETSARVTKIELLLDGEVVRTAESVDVRSFTELVSSKIYTLRVTYEYDLNDAKGFQSVSQDMKMETMAQEIQISKVTWLGTGEIKHKDFVTLMIDVTNPDSVTIDSFTINGQKCLAEKTSAKIYTVLYQVFSYGGPHDLTFTGLNYSGKEMSFLQAVSFFSEDIFVVKEVFIEEEGEVVLEQVIAGEYYSSSTMTVELVFQNSEAYLLQSIYIGETPYPLTYVNATTYTASIPTNIQSIYSMESHSFVFGSVKYEKNGNAILQNIADTTVKYVTGPNAGKVIEITTPAQLQNMTSFGYYRLMNDIDLSGFDWKPYKFTGVLDGNGYTIRNLSLENCASWHTSLGYCVGMFTEIEYGYIFRLNVKNALVRSILPVGPSMEFGGILAGYTSLDVIFSRCNIEGDIVRIVQLAADATPQYGGFVGTGGDFEDCSFRGTIALSFTEWPSDIPEVMQESFFCGAFSGQPELIKNCSAEMDMLYCGTLRPIFGPNDNYHGYGNEEIFIHFTVKNITERS